MSNSKSPEPDVVTEEIPSSSSTTAAPTVSFRGRSRKRISTWDHLCYLLDLIALCQKMQRKHRTGVTEAIKYFADLQEKYESFEQEFIKIEEAVMELVDNEIFNEMEKDDI